MAKVLVTRPIPGKALEKLKKAHEVEVYSGPDKMPREKLLESVKGVDAILSTLTERIDKEVFEATGNQLKIVANYAVGFDNIDVKEAKARGVMVGNTPSSLGDAVAEFAVTLAMCLARQVLPADEFVRAEKYKVWDPNIFLGIDLSKKVLGIVGAGTIGSVVGKRMQAVFDMKVIYHNRSKNEEFEKVTGGKLVSLKELVEKADVISLHVPLTDETRHMIGGEEFGKMKSSAILINTARGPVVHEGALVEALEKKKIWGAALDVFEEEVKGEHKHLDKTDWAKLKRLKNVILTPHIASATQEAREEMSEMAVDNILRALGGEKPKYLVEARR